MNGTHYNAEKLAAIRKERFTQKEVADALNVHENTIGRAENGIVASYELLLGLCELLEIDIREILIVDTSRPAKNFSRVATIPC